MIRCTKCGKSFTPGNVGGLPNGVGFQLDNGTLINICRECLIEVGEMDDKDRDKFFEELCKGEEK